ncbi:adenylosuccinate synthetase [Hoeflea sp.]|uniref:adenylosuccinate synthetase n=1 Tax=Hoeflea sp. TaxID=1940281 RepID=UPI003B017E18
MSELLEGRSSGSTPTGLYVVDSVRVEGQIAAIRKAYGEDVHHIHLTAQDAELKTRFKKRKADGDEDVTYEKLKRNRTEKNIEKLADLADVVVSTDRCTSGAVLVRATALLNLYPRGSDALVDVIVGGQFGSEGKGNIVGHIAPEYDLLVRVGGPNAGHSVYAEPDPEKYYHLPSGTERAPNAKLLLGPGAVINPTKLLDEIAHHQLGTDRLFIDPQAMVITDDDIAEEVKKFGNISSTAQGVGIASAQKILGRSDYKDGTSLHLARDHDLLGKYTQKPAHEIIADAFVEGNRIMLEGTQGTSLSLHHGEYPHVTSRDTTVSGCLADAGIAPKNVRRIVLVCRTYPIRVGGPSGKMELEVKIEEIAKRSGIPLNELKKTERTTTTDRPRRIAEFDWEQLKQSVQLNGPTDVALTFVDYFTIKNRDAYRFEQLSEETLRFVEEVERVSGRPVSLLSTAFDWRNVIDRRSW